MERDPQQDWSLLQDEALRTVRAGATGSQRGWRVAQFVMLPFFPHCDSLDIRQVASAAGVVAVGQSSYHPESDQYQLVRTRWRMDVDEQKLATPLKVPSERFRHHGPPKPTIETDVRPLAAGQVEAIRQRLLKIPVPLPLRPTSFGADGVFYELYVESSFTEMTLKWWCDTPPGWEPLATAFHEIMAELNKEFAAS